MFVQGVKKKTPKNTTTCSALQRSIYFHGYLINHSERCFCDQQGFSFRRDIYIPDNRPVLAQ